jgi:predicted DCC family thiol-disulfide oxidoreductase YuxK
MNTSVHKRATLVFDGDCAICRRWVNYWQELTGQQLNFRPYQEAALDFPMISREAFRTSIQYIAPDGQVFSGAAATFQVLRHAPARAPWWWCYEHITAFAAVSEWAYTFFARRRGLLSALTRVLWGPVLHAERYALVSWIFLRGLGAIYIAAFASLAVQVLGLVGHDGILPVAEYLTAAHGALGTAAYWFLPTLFWLNSTDSALVAVTLAGVLLGALVVVNKWTRPALIGLFLLYLSCAYAGQDFMNFQWDALLLESGFLAIFLTTGSRLVVWLYRWLLFRFLFLAGIVKVLSGDLTWHGLTALEYHFWTQPLPTPLAWYAAQFPAWILKAGTAATLLIEVGVAFLIFLPRRVRAFAACGVLLLQLLITLTGNYNFFNLLTMLLCIFLWDDAALRRTLPLSLQARVQQRAPHPRRAATIVATLLTLLVVPIGVNRIWQTVEGANLPVLGTLTLLVSPFDIVNSYGLFAIMTTARPEIVIEGSDDGVNWREYVFRYKPGPLSRRPLWNIPHQPRLDWQMWFAALGSARESHWIESLVWQLLKGSPAVLGLLEENPFPGGAPRYIRAALYDYRFADLSTHQQTGQWWVRRLQGEYFPEVKLSDFVRPATDTAR